jgi:uncharacterized protein YndB with AHSA1/START domain
MTDPTPTATTDQGEVLITRVFDAPREQVFAAWTDPEQIAQWYGPERLDVPHEHVHVDLRVGGLYELLMIDRESGARYPLRYEIVELVVPELLVLRCPAMPEMGLPYDVTTRVELHDHGDRTRMTLSDGPYRAPGRGQAEAGWNAAVAKLAHLVTASG